MKKLIRVAALSVMAISLTGGVAAAQTTIGTTGPRSDNFVTNRNRETRNTRNDNNVVAANINPQAARTGSSRSQGNTTAGSSTSGDATNDSLMRARVSVTNTAPMAVGSSTAATNSNSAINNTGPNSNNVVRNSNESTVTVRNNNNVGVVNFNLQEASSGSSRVSGNTTGGNARSGNASNISTNETTIEIRN